MNKVSKKNKQAFAIHNVSGSLFNETGLNEIIHKISHRIGRIELCGQLNGNVGLLHFKGIDKKNECGSIMIDYR
jgi:hypothetical protein